MLDSARPGDICYTSCMRASHNSQVSAFIDALPLWQRDICAKVRQLIHEVEPAVEEVIKRGDRPYFVLHGNVCALQAAKDHVNVFIYDPIAPDPHHLINQGQGNKTARAIQMHQGDALNGRAFKALITTIADNNRAGGWRKLKR